MARGAEGGPFHPLLRRIARQGDLPADHQPLRCRSAADLRQSLGNAGPELDRAAKQTNELILPDDAVWSDLKRALQQSMSVGLGKYQRDVKFLAGSDHKSLYAEPLRVKKYDIGGQFSWHIDCNSAQNHSRCLAVQWYFNDVSEGGATEFEDQKTAIACREGRLAFFPVSWTYRHRGAPPLSWPKYVCTTFIHYQGSRQSAVGSRQSFVHCLMPTAECLMPAHHILTILRQAAA